MGVTYKVFEGSGSLRAHRLVRAAGRRRLNGEGPLAHRNQEIGRLEFDEFPLDQFAARLGKEHLLPVGSSIEALGCAASGIPGPARDSCFDRRPSPSGFGLAALCPQSRR